MVEPELTLLWQDGKHIRVYKPPYTLDAELVLRKCHNYRLDRFYDPVLGEGVDEDTQAALMLLWCLISDPAKLEAEDPEYVLGPDPLHRIFPGVEEVEAMVGLWHPFLFDNWWTDKPAEPCTTARPGLVFWSGIFL